MVINSQKLIEIRYRAYHDIIEHRLLNDGILWLQTIVEVSELDGCGRWESAWAEAICSKNQREFFQWVGQDGIDGHQCRLRSPLLPLLTDRERWLVLKGTCPTRVLKTVVGDHLKSDFEFRVLACLGAEFDGRRVPELTFHLTYILGA